MGWNLDDTHHDTGAVQCRCDDVCSQCGGIVHFQGIYGGYLKVCEGCDAYGDRSEFFEDDDREVK